MGVTNGPVASSQLYLCWAKLGQGRGFFFPQFGLVAAPKICKATMGVTDGPVASSEFYLCWGREGQGRGVSSVAWAQGSSHDLQESPRVSPMVSEQP